MSRPRVLIVSGFDISRDPRVLRHCAALTPVADFITVGPGSRSAPSVTAHVAMPDSIGHLPTSPGGLAALAARRHARAYESIPLVEALREAISTAPDFDVILANDAVTLPVSLEQSGGRPVVGDLHEYAPREMDDDLRWRLSMKPLVTWMCRTTLSRLARVITVAPGIAAEYKRVFGVDASVVMNAGTDSQRTPSTTGAPIRLVHSGNAVSNRRIEVMIEAAADLPNVTFDLLLVPAPRMGRYRAALESAAQRTANVRVLDPVPMAGLIDRLAEYDVGVYSLAPSNFNNLHALPNKFFDFIQARLGVVVGPSPEMATLVREHRLGAVADDFDAPALREVLASLNAQVVDTWKSSVDAAAGSLGAAAQAAILRTVVLDAAGAR